MKILTFDEYTDLIKPLLDYDRPWARNYLWLYRSNISTELLDLERHPELAALAATKHSEQAREFRNLQKTLEDKLVALRNIDPNIDKDEKKKIRKDFRDTKHALQNAKRNLIRTMIKHWKELNAEKKQIARASLQEEHRLVYHTYILPALTNAADSGPLNIDLITRKFFGEGQPLDPEAPLQNQVNKACLIFSRFRNLHDQCVEKPLHEEKKSRTPMEQKIREAVQQVTAAAIDLGHRAVGFGEITDTKFLALLGHEILLVGLLSHWCELDPEAMANERAKVQVRGVDPTRFRDDEFHLLYPAALYFTQTTQDIAHSNLSDLPVPSADTDASFVRMSTAKAIASTADALAAEAARQQDSIAHPEHRVFSKLFSNAYHREYGLDEPIDTDDPEVREEFLEEHLREHLEVARNRFSAPSLVARINQVEKGYQSFDYYVHSMTPRLGHTGGRLFPRSWLATAESEGSHPRFFLWGADYHQAVCLAACAVQEIDPKTLPPVSPESLEREDWSLPVCFLTQRYFYSDPSARDFLLSRVEIDQYTDTLVAGKPVHSQILADFRQMAEGVRQAQESKALREGTLNRLFVRCKEECIPRGWQ